MLQCYHQKYGKFRNILQRALLNFNGTLKGEKNNRIMSQFPHYLTYSYFISLKKRKKKKPCKWQASQKNIFFLFYFQWVSEKTICSYQFPSNLSRHSSLSTRTIQVSLLLNIPKLKSLFNWLIRLCDWFPDISNKSSLWFCDKASTLHCLQSI